MGAHGNNGTAGGYLLELRDLRTYFTSDEGTARAVDGISYAIPAGETLGVVGESGSGKSVAALSVMGLIPSPPGQVVGGEILFKGRTCLRRVPRRCAASVATRSP